MSTQLIRVLIADGQPIVLEGLRYVLSQYSHIQVVGEAADGVEMIEKAMHLEPDIILLDFKLPRVDGLAVLRNIRERILGAKVIMFASSDSKDDFVEAMKLGCSGILLKENATALIEKSIQRVQAGEIWLDSNTTAAVIRHFASPKDFPAAHTSASNSASGSKSSRERAQLSQREREIIILIAQGYKNKEIAEKMFITEQTVKNHLHNVFDKLGVSDRLELALYAIHNSLHVKV